jgi:hypothetical protein
MVEQNALLCALKRSIKVSVSNLYKNEGKSDTTGRNRVCPMIKSFIATY